MKRRYAVILPFVLAGACSQAPAEERSNLPSGPVVDAADILPEDEEASLDRQLRDWSVETGNSLVVSTVPTLGGRPIEDVAFEQFNGWGIGDSETDRGLLLLLAPNDRQVRIEVGCGLERVITDAAAAEIIQSDIIPAFRSGDMVGGVRQGTTALIRQTEDKIANAEDGPLSSECLSNLKEAA